MILYIIISILSLVLLVALHELGHFLVAKYFGVKVEEFGIGIPPRLISKKFGETVYSLNLIPIGAFVKIYGEDKKIKDKRSFSEKTTSQRALILLGGVIAFWIVAFILLTIIMGLGFPAPISDDVHYPDARVMILSVEDGFPAEEIGILPGDTILQLSSHLESTRISKVSDVRDFLRDNRGENILVSLKRGSLIKNLELISLEDDGIMGVFLQRTRIQRYPWYQAPVRGALMTGEITINMVYFLGGMLRNAVLGRPLPPGARMAGPVGIVRDFFAGAIQRGFVDYLQVMVMVSISLAIFNLLPIPALDGGRLLFLLIEKIKGSPIKEAIEQKMIIYSFLVLLGLFALVTFNDIWG